MRKSFMFILFFLLILGFSVSAQNLEQQQIQLLEADSVFFDVEGVPISDQEAELVDGGQFHTVVVAVAAAVIAGVFGDAIKDVVKTATGRTPYEWAKEGVTEAVKAVESMAKSYGRNRNRVWEGWGTK